jgi:hypothetical protein
VREGFAELVETTCPQLTILAYPGIEISEGIGAK